MQAKSYLPLFKAAYNDWSEDKASRLAAALAYYTALSLAPMVVLGVLALKPLPVNGESAVANQMAMLMGESGRQMAQTMIENANQRSGWLAGTISVIILICGASNVFAELQDSMNTIWEVQPRPDLGWWGTIKKRFLSMAMVLGIGFLLLTSLFVSSVLTGMAHKLAGEGKVVGFALDIVLTLLVTTVFFAAIFKLLPDVKLGWRDVLPGAVLTGVLFTLGKYLLSIYLTKGSATSSFGAAGSLAAVLIWVYYSAQIMFFGAEFTQAYAEKFGSQIEPDEDAIPVTEEKRAQLGLMREHDKKAATEGRAALAAQRGATYPRQAVPPRRVVTITKPTPESNRAYAVAGAGLAAGFVVGALGMLTGRRYQRGGINQIALDRRLAELENRLGETPPTVAATAARIREHLTTLDARLTAASQATKQRVRNAAAPTGSVRERFNAAVERQERKHNPTIVDRLTGHRRQPTWFERLNELVS